MTFNEWLNQDDGYGIRCNRLFEDIRMSVEQEKTDDIIKWLMAAYAMGHEKGYNTGYYDCSRKR
jgi:hypothetical protein